MDKMCKEAGIKRHITCTYTPQQNGLAERMNRTIADKIRCMLAESGLENKFWAEAAATAVYLINITPNASIEFKNPEEAWSGVKVEFSHLRRFGCVAYVHTVQDKMSPRALKGIFMGYPQGTKGYRVWLPEEEKSTISRSVVFDEESLYMKSKEKEAEVSPKSKRLTFKADLIKGPTRRGSTVEFGSTSGSGNTNEGGAILNKEGSSDSEEEEVETVQEVGDTETSLDDYLLARDRVRRQIKPPGIFESGDFVAYALTSAADLEVNEPRSYAKAKRSKDWKKWNASMDEEKDSLEKNGTWDVGERPQRQRIIGC